MKYTNLLLVLYFLCSGCGVQERERELDRKMQEVNRKEQQLLLKEEALQLKEEELARKEKLKDTSLTNAADSFFASHPQVPGKWAVTMRCIETNCSGSAVGDTKNEQWEITYENNAIVAKAYSNDELVCVYSGPGNGSIVELSTQPDNPDPSLSTKMVVRIQEIKEKEMQGQREIIRPENCRIIYSLDFKKQ